MLGPAVQRLMVSLRRYFGELAIDSSKRSISARKTFSGEGFSIPLYYARPPFHHRVFTLHQNPEPHWSRRMAFPDGKEAKRTRDGVGITARLATLTLGGRKSQPAPLRNTPLDRNSRARPSSPCRETEPQQPTGEASPSITTCKKSSCRKRR